MLDTIIDLITIPTDLFFSLICQIFAIIFGFFSLIGMIIGVLIILKFLSFYYEYQEDKASGSLRSSPNPIYSALNPRKSRRKNRK